MCTITSSPGWPASQSARSRRAVALATRFQLLPEVVDPSFILTGSGLGGLIGGAYAALRQYPAPRLARVVLLGGLGATAVFVVGVTGVL